MKESCLASHKSKCPLESPPIRNVEAPVVEAGVKDVVSLRSGHGERKDGPVGANDDGFAVIYSLCR